VLEKHKKSKNLFEVARGFWVKYRTLICLLQTA
jgi:hypothetical protein